MSSRFNSNLSTLLIEGLDWYIQERDRKSKTDTEVFLASIHSGSHGRSDNSETKQKSYFARGMPEQRRCCNQQQFMSSEHVYIDNKHHFIDKIIKKTDPGF